MVVEQEQDQQEQQQADDELNARRPMQLWLGGDVMNQRDRDGDDAMW